MKLLFSQEWPLVPVLLAALALGGASWILYRREIRHLQAPYASLLPWLRSTAIALLVLLLCGPVVHRRVTSGKLPRLVCLIDVSQSMGIPDPNLPLATKIALCEQLGWIPSNLVPRETSLALSALAEAGTLLRQASEPAFPQPESVLRPFVQHITQASTLLQRAGLSTELVERLQRELAEPASELAANPLPDADNHRLLRQAITRFADSSDRWKKEAAQLAENTLQSLLSHQPQTRAALQRLDATPRLERLSQILLSGAQQSPIARLASRFELELLPLDDPKPAPIWLASDGLHKLPASLPAPQAPSSNLAASLLALLQSPQPNPTVLLFSDGRHNSGPDPVSAARRLGEKGTPVFPVGIGQAASPIDLALLSIDSPESVFREDRLRGSLSLAERAPQGLPFVAQIRSGERIVWEQSFTTLGSPLRKIPFDFAVKDLLPPTQGPADTTLRSSPVSFSVSVQPLPAEREHRNNHASFQIRVTDRRRKLLLVDGRPRWETRYLRNLFERNPQWEVLTVLGPPDQNPSSSSPDSPSSFPSAEAALHSFDLLILGEFPRPLLSPQQLEWITSFVSEHAGGLLLLDGRRGILRQHAQGPLAPLFPVRFPPADIHSPHPGLAPNALRPTPLARSLAPFALTSSAEQSEKIWQSLPPPRWLARCEALPGTETLLEGVLDSNPLPAIVSKFYGAGRVAYCAFDESWRWRLDIGSAYQDKFWTQMAEWLAEPPYALQTPHFSFDVGSARYAPGDAAEIRIRIPQSQPAPSLAGKPVPLELRKDGAPQSSLLLRPTEGRTGLFQARTPPLEPGHYEVLLPHPPAPPAGVPGDPIPPKLSFDVTPREAGELNDLTQNLPLLRQLAAVSGGSLRSEEQIGSLVDTLAASHPVRARDQQTPLAQSPAWFALIVSILTLEWILRKRLGLV